jgi:parvulin-like peptidyl-prolyl isomerase
MRVCQCARTVSDFGNLLALTPLRGRHVGLYKGCIKEGHTASPMRKKNTQVRGKCLTVVLLTSLLTCIALAQRTGTPLKSAGKEASPLLAAPAAGSPAAATSTDEVVLKVGATQVTQSQIESLVTVQPSGKQKLNAEGRRHMAEMYVRVLLLSQQAENDHLETSPELRSRLEMLRNRMLAQAEYDKMRGQIQVDPDEVTKYYIGHASEFDTIQVREFLVRKRQPEAEDSDSQGLSATDAKAKAESVRKAFASGDSVEKVAEDFAPDVVLIDPKPRTLRRNEMIPALEKATFDVSDGGVTEAVDTPEAVLVVYVLKRGHIEQKEAATEIEKKLRQSKLETQIEDLKKKAGVWMDEDYFKNEPAVTPVPSASPTASDARPTPSAN